MLLSSACEYGLRAALYLATRSENGYVPVRKISEALDISAPFLTKIFQKLTEAGLMTSLRGPSGGLSFATPPSQISVKDIILAIDGNRLFVECVLGLPGCGREKPCPIHNQWAGERGRLETMFTSMTLAELARQIGPDVRLRAGCEDEASPFR